MRYIRSSLTISGNVSDFHSLFNDQILHNTDTSGFLELKLIYD